MRIQARNLKRTEILKILLNEYSRKLLTPTFLFSYFGYQMLYVNSRALDPDTVRILPDPDPGCFTWSRTSIEFRLLNKKMVIRFFCLYLNFILALFYNHTVLFLIFLKKKCITKYEIKLETFIIIIYLNAWLLLQLLLEPDWSSIMMICDAIRQGDTNPK